MTPTAEATKTGQEKGGAPKEKLHIFINRRKFEVEDGVKELMSGREIAALAKVPENLAGVKKEDGPDKREIALDEPVQIQQADHFLVTRSEVNGGYVA